MSRMMSGLWYRLVSRICFVVSSLILVTCFASTFKPNCFMSKYQSEWCALYCGKRSCERENKASKTFLIDFYAFRMTYTK